MAKLTLYEQQLNVLNTEWAFTQESIRNLDDIVFRIRGWAVTLSSGALGYAYVDNDHSLCLYLSLPTAIFWVIDGLFRSFQRKFIIRDREIRNYFSSSDFTHDYNLGEIIRISIAKSYSNQENRNGWTFGNIKNHIISMFLRNVFLTYLAIFALQIATYWLVLNKEFFL